MGPGDWRYYRQFVGNVSHFRMAELDALPWDDFLEEVVTAIRLHRDLRA